jgi:hypothetical protein
MLDSEWWVLFAFVTFIGAFSQTYRPAQPSD